MRDFDIIHRVEYGETIGHIADMYGVPASVIAAENKLSGDIYAGKWLIIPAVGGEVYKVMPTDDIKGIAQKFGISEERILKDNNTDFIYPFMELIIKK